jgi:hypothetical protein
MNDWNLIKSAPYDREIELTVMVRGKIVPLGFACRRVVGGWIKTENRKWLEINPVRRRDWQNFEQ